MSNGVPGPEEGNEPPAPGGHTLFALAYLCVWILGAALTFVFDIGAIKQRMWLVWASVALLVVTLVILGRDFYRLGPSKRSPRP